MTTPTEDSRAVLLALHHENSTQSRHHEQQRQLVTTTVAVVAAVVLGFLFSGGNEIRLHHNYGLLLHAFFLVVIGTYGFVASLRHYERSRLHVQRVHRVREELSQLFPVNILDLYAAANKEHVKKFPVLSERTARIFYAWQLVHASVVIVGALLFLLVTVGPLL